MARIYNTIIDQLSTNSQEIPTGWGSLVDDSDDHDHAEPVPKSGDLAYPRPPNTRVYFPLPANREQRRIVEGIANDAVYWCKDRRELEKVTQLRIWFVICWRQISAYSSPLKLAVRCGPKDKLPN